ncbi:hypothetical protein PR202_ga10699 [Eleusine coracana subsp. coracana]|uniref:F-box domain-containing protein n=1 Tax=Eleusine coracana subsp. coracana TaxID=191504 RepID=A0AAV5C7K6_ELECO|nr:hypothetical protein PR202_ga10699 [Eleusine coracana subsp. coracana]
MVENLADSCPALDWSRLQQDLLIRIFSQLEVPDLVYSGAVCISWHLSYMAKCVVSDVAPVSRVHTLYTPLGTAAAMPPPCITSPPTRYAMPLSRIHLSAVDTS